MSVPAVVAGTGQGWCLVAPGDSSRARPPVRRVLLMTCPWCCQHRPGHPRLAWSGACPARGAV